MDKDWLKKKLTIEQAEAEHMLTDRRLGAGPVLFGFCNRQWRELLKKMQDEDESWEFSRPPETWYNLCGRAGIALVRNGNMTASKQKQDRPMREWTLTANRFLSNQQCLR